MWSRLSQASVIFLLGLAACPDPKVSGPGALVGRLLDAGGQPVVGARVDGVEAGARTGDDGHFAVRMKDPDRFVIIGAGGRLYRRPWREADDGQVIEVRLPALRDAALECALANPCRAKLSWAWPDGLAIDVEADCDPSASVPLAGIPAEPPSAVRCLADGQPVEVSPLDGGARLTLGPTAAPVRVRILGRGADDQRGCTVLVDGRLAMPTPDGAFVGQAAGRAVISATCEDRPAIPVLMAPGQAEVEIEWSPTGVDLRVEGAPDVETLLVVREGGPGFSIRSTAAAGAFRLPPLTAGQYRVASTAQGLVAAEPLPKPEREGLVLARSELGVSGWLRLDADREEGVIVGDAR